MHRVIVIIIKAKSAWNQRHQKPHSTHFRHFQIIRKSKISVLNIPKRCWNRVLKKNLDQNFTEGQNSSASSSSEKGEWETFADRLQQQQTTDWS